MLLGGAMTFGGSPAAWAAASSPRSGEVRRLALPRLAEDTAIEFATLGGDAGYIGAAGVARLDHQQGRG